MALLSVHDLQKVYEEGGARTPALRGISLDIEAGEFVAIMGPSGSGKSTLLHILGFLDRPTGGAYRFDGKTIDDYTKDEAAAVRNGKMGFIFQAFNLLPRATVLENVTLPLMYSDAPERSWEGRAMQAIAAVNLVERAHHNASQLSGGEKQRAAIARALVNDPQVIFADEPTGNLDSKSGGQVMEALQRLNEEDRHTIVLITHESYAAAYAERIISILDGRIESDATVAERWRVGDGYGK